MQANRPLTQLTEPNPAGRAHVSWANAYLRFLFSRDESVALKIAPLALVGLLPVDILSNIIPAVGELDDVGFLIAMAVIVSRTFSRVRRYR